MIRTRRSECVACISRIGDEMFKLESANIRPEDNARLDELVAERKQIGKTFEETFSVEEADWEGDVIWTYNGWCTECGFGAQDADVIHLKKKDGGQMPRSL